MKNLECLQHAHEMFMEIDALDDNDLEKASDILDFCNLMNESYNSNGEADSFIRELLSNDFEVNYVDYKEKIGYEDWMDEYVDKAQLLFDCLDLISTAEAISHSTSIRI